VEDAGINASSVLVRCCSWHERSSVDSQAEKGGLSMALDLP